MKYLGIDYGEKRVGIALSDDGGRVAMPSLILDNSETLLAEVKELCREMKIGTVVMGLSLDSSGKENPIMKKAKSFAIVLEKNTKTPVVFEKEWFSTVEARRAPGAKAQVDDAAAALVLQRYLDRLNKVTAEPGPELEDNED